MTAMSIPIVTWKITFENVQKRLNASIPQKLKLGMTVTPFVISEMKFSRPTKLAAGASNRRLRRP